MLVVVALSAGAVPPTVGKTDTAIDNNQHWLWDLYGD